MAYNLTESELQERAERATIYGATVKITGLWAWATFPEKPNAEIRGQLKQAGWKWSHKKLAWYLPGKRCASKKSHSFEYIAEKYGVIDIEQKALAIA